ncbi:hypothetical protein [Bradyrhizobium sp. CCBAU 45384]
MRCKDCSEVRGYPYKRSHLVALRPASCAAAGEDFSERSAIDVVVGER